MNMEKGNFVWQSSIPHLNKNKIDGVALHHMHHPTADEYEVEKWHLDNGWLGFGYNWWIGFDGHIVEGRGWRRPAGVKGFNDTVLSIGFQGGYEPTDKFECTTVMPAAQFNAGVQLIKWLKPQLPKLQKTAGHNYWNATSCPGTYFPLDEMIHAAEDTKTPWEIIDWLKEKGILSDTQYWKNAVSIVKHLDKLFENIYERMG